MSLYIRPSDYRELCKPQGPFFAFLIPWTAVLLGQMAALCNIIVPIYSPFYLIVLGNMVSLIMIAFFAQTFFPQKLSVDTKTIKAIYIGARFKKLVFFSIGIYFFMQLFQVVYFRGFPLLWIVMKSSKTYADYGIGSLNGLLNALFLLSSTSLFIIFLKEKKKWQGVLLATLLMVPVLLVTRQLLMSLFLQIASVGLIYSKKAFRWMVAAGIALLAIFVIVGNLRTGLNTIVKILGPEDFIPEFLYPLLWIYAYIVTPFNNINAAFDSITPLGNAYHEISTIVPSIFRQSIGLEGGYTGFTLVHKNMTVSTFYIEPLLDFGPLWAFFFMALFQVLWIRSFRKASQTKLPLHILEYSVYYMIGILSIFSNLFLYLPVIAQLLLINVAKFGFFRRGKNLFIAVREKI
jgi:oligosaccharide repeat unit polymerase